MKKAITIIMLFLAGLPAWPRVVSPWSPAELQTAAQLIVVGTLTNVRDLAETNTTLWSGSCKMLGLEATFAVSKVLKGDFTNRTVVLHYYRWDTPFKTSDFDSTFGTDVDSPGLIWFAPDSTNRFLLYLVRDGASRYAPASGQLYEAGYSVRTLADNGADAEIDKALTSQIANVLKECQTIRPGMIRAELSKIFTTEGGLSTARHRTYVFRGCPYIKVDVDFTPSDQNQNPLEEKPTDIITKISKPYLDWAIID